MLTRRTGPGDPGPPLRALGVTALLGVAVLLVSLAGLSTPLAAQGEPSPCDRLFQLVDAGLLEAAAEGFQAAFGEADEEDVEVPTGPPPQCIEEVAEELARGYRERGDTLSRIGAVGAAGEAYRNAVRWDPELTDELGPLLVETPADPFASVRHLASLGELGAARERLETILAAPGAGAVPEDLHYLHGGLWETWRTVRGGVYRWLPTLMEVLLALLVVGTLLLLAVRGIRALVPDDSQPLARVIQDLKLNKGDARATIRWFVYYVGAALFLAGVTAVGTGKELFGLARLSILPGLLVFLLAGLWLIVRPPRRRLIIEEMVGSGDGAPGGAALQATVRSQIFELAKSQPGSELPIHTAAAEDVEIPAIVGRASTAAQGFAAVLQQLWRWLSLRPLEITGQVQRSGHRNAGLTLQLHLGNKVLATTTLWHATYAPEGGADRKGDGAAYHLLAELAAVWALFQLKAEQQQPLNLLGTADWQAFAFFHAGVRAFEARDYPRARYCFEWALLRDGKFAAAHFNLFKTLYFLESRDEGDKETGQRHIEKALTHLGEQGEDKENDEARTARVEPSAQGCDGGSEDSIPWCELWQTLEEAADWEGKTGTSEQGAHLEEPQECSLYIKARYAELVLSVEAHFEQVKKPTESPEGWRSFHDSVRNWCDDLKPFAAKLRGITRATRPMDTKSRGSVRPDPTCELGFISRRYAAALQPVLAQVELFARGPGDCRVREHVKTLQGRADEGPPIFCANLPDLLACWLELKPAGEESENAGAKSDKGCQGEQKVQGGEKGEVEDPCKRAEAAAALRSLKRSIRLEDFRERKLLEWLRRKEGGEGRPCFRLIQCSEFRKLAEGGARHRPPPLQLARLSRVGENRARVLARQGIETLEGLLVTTARKSERRRLAADLQVGRERILRWARLAELCRVDGLVEALGAEGLDLLDREDFGSLEALAGCKPKELDCLLASLRRELGPDLDLQREDLTTWSDRAERSLPSMVKGRA